MYKKCLEKGNPYRSKAGHWIPGAGVGEEPWPLGTEFVTGELRSDYGEGGATEVTQRTTDCSF